MLQNLMHTNKSFQDLGWHENEKSKTLFSFSTEFSKIYSIDDVHSLLLLYKLQPMYNTLVVDGS